MHKSSTVTIVGGGLAGSESAWQLAKNGIHVYLYEMRPVVSTGAHKTSNLAELVCSNSLGSNQSDRASGILMNELKVCHSFILECAMSTSVPAGNALAVDREKFSELVSEKIYSHPNISIIRSEVVDLPPGPTIIASGPLTSESLMSSITQLTGEHNLFFFDAIAPIVSRESINMDIAFFGSRFGDKTNEDGDYINCPFTKEEYETFVTELNNAGTIPLREFEKDNSSASQSDKPEYFEGCLPIEVLAKRGTRSLSFGPMRPIGLKDPRSGKGSYAVIQLRRDNLAGSLYNMVGFQTNLLYPEQKRVFRLIPGLENAEFIRMGQMHRNSFLVSPRLLNSSLQFKSRKDLFFAGQITGIEGYLGNVGSGIVSSWNMTRHLNNLELISFPRETLIGSLCHYVENADASTFQPMKANLGLLPGLSQKYPSKKQRANQYSIRSAQVLLDFLHEYSLEC